MALNTRSIPKMFLGAFLVTACSATVILPMAHRCQAVIVVDKTNSVDFTNRLPKLQTELSDGLYRTYASSTKDIRCSRLIIKDVTGVFPDRDYFREDHPEGDEDSRIYQQQLQRWSMNKRKWISDEIKQVFALIQSPCNHNSTDIFSVFSGIQQVQNTDGPWDSINVFIFSDMTNTTRHLNMINGMSDANAEEKGKSECQHMIRQREIAKGATGNLYFTIYTPDNMQNTNRVNQFWIGFFEEWGLARNHYRFE